jgi:predicted phosphoadenosine phosphosulfate sulfurtransferase
MSLKQVMGINVLDAALDRIRELYDKGLRPVVSTSGGKDSSAILELTIMVAKERNKLPVDAVTRDEEIMFPGTYEYLERVHSRTEEVNLHWLVARQPIVNAFDRSNPYFWAFDPLLPPSKWVRVYPDFTEFMPQLDILSMTTKERFPPEERGMPVSIMGLRSEESWRRMVTIHMSKGHMTLHPNAKGVYHSRPIYDWKDGDVWLFVKKFNLDYCTAYDTMLKLGVPRRRLRLAPPTLVGKALDDLKMASQAWPSWWERVCDRLPGMRTAAMFGKRAVTPQRRLGETWEDCFKRTCLGDDTPEWIRNRAIKVSDQILRMHGRHSTAPLPQVQHCRMCKDSMGSWRKLALTMFMGDPIGTSQKLLPAVEPEFFRPGAGQWLGPASF